MHGRRCSARKPCPKPFVCDIIDKTCKRRGEVSAQIEAENELALAPPVVEKRNRHSKWSKTMTPGSRGFNEYATQMMIKDGLLKPPFDIQCPVPGKTVLQAYQQTVRYLVHPDTPIHRFLVAHRTGLGKTLTMIKILENFYHDPRSKVIIFPNDKVRNNFYQELMKFPNPYRQYVFKILGKRLDILKDLHRIIDVLAMKGQLRQAGKKGFLAAPLRAIRYTIAGGSQVFPRPGNRPSHPLFHTGYNGRNPYDDKIVLMDECHNLIRPDEETKKFRRKLDRLREGLIQARHSVVVGLTATPVPEAPEDLTAMMQVIKGAEYQHTETDEGFVSYYQHLPRSVYPVIDPQASTEGHPHLVRVELEGENRKVYEKKVKAKLRPVKLLNYCCMGQSYRASIKPSTRFGKLLRQKPVSAATKLARVVHDVLTSPFKSLVVIHREDGFKALETLFEEAAQHLRFESQNQTCAHPAQCWYSLYEKPRLKDEQVLNTFNAPENRRGDLLKVILVDSKFYSEGVSFKGVRRLVMVDVPRSWANYKQILGRVLRFCGHSALPRMEWQVEMSIYLATHPTQETADEHYLKEIIRQKELLEAPMQHLAAIAVDRVILEQVGKPTPRQGWWEWAHSHARHWAGYDREEDDDGTL